MTESYELEKKMAAALNASNTTDLQRQELIALRKKAVKLSRKGKYEKAAISFGALARVVEDDLDFPLRAAHFYQKAAEHEDAAYWFLQAAERYAQQNYPTQAVAALRLYHGLKPDDHQGPKRVYKLCRSQGDGSEILPFLSSKDKAGRKLHGSDFFSIFDDQAFDIILDKMNYLKLTDKEGIVQMGDAAVSLFFVVCGAVDGYLMINDQRSYLGVIGEGDICGETAYFTGGRRTAEMVAKGETELLELPYELIDTLKENSPELNDHLEAIYRNRMLVKQLTLTSLFEGVDVKCRQEIAEKMTSMRLPAGQVLFREREPCLDLYTVRTGKLAVNILVNGSERLVKTIETGGVVGEIAIAAGKRRTATVRTISDCTLMKLDATDYLKVYQEYTSLKKVIHARKLAQMEEVRNLIQNVTMVEGDDTCELLLKDIWQSQTISKPPSVRKL